MDRAKMRQSTGTGRDRQESAAGRDRPNSHAHGRRQKAEDGRLLLVVDVGGVLDLVPDGVEADAVGGLVDQNVACGAVAAACSISRAD